MVKIRTLIVDDEPLARQRLRTLLESDPDITLVGECGDGREAVAALREQQPDLVFLDVQMPELDGFGVLRALNQERMPAVIFVTAHDRYALRAFEVHALDYLLKPFDKDRFRTALERAKAQVRREQGGDVGQRLLDLLRDVQESRKPQERLVVKSGSRVYFVRVEDIDWIEAAGNYVRLHVGKEDHLLRESMGGLEARLHSNRFLRIHRSTIANIERIRELQPSFHGDYVVILQDGTELTLSRGYRDKLQGLLGHSF
jgi:two-component system, LytTR family, response regulator